MAVPSLALWRSGASAAPRPEYTCGPCRPRRAMVMTYPVVGLYFGRAPLSETARGRGLNFALNRCRGRSAAFSERLRMNDIQMAIANKILAATVNNAGPRDEKTVAALWFELEATGLEQDALATLQKIVARGLGQEDKSLHDPMRYDGVGRPIDFGHLVREAATEEIDRYLLSFDSYKRARAMYLLMCGLHARHCLQTFLRWGNMCDAPWPYRSYLARELRSARAEVALIAVLEPDALTFYTRLPDPVQIWRGCERGRERGLSWTVDRAIAEGFARGKRCVNQHPTLAAAEIPKQHIFGVFLDRKESELAVDPRRLRELHAQAYAVQQQ